MSTMIYTGIGSRKTPEPILRKMRVLGIALAREGCLLWSGAAPGADTAFEQGCDQAKGDKDIYLPWKGFQNHPSELYIIPQEAFEVAADMYGSSWQYLKRPTKLLMARDIQQVLGYHVDGETDVVICWTPDGCNKRSERTRKTGGTGQAIACASAYGVPVFNLGREGDEEKLLEFFGDYFDVALATN